MTAPDPAYQMQVYFARQGREALMALQDAGVPGPIAAGIVCRAMLQASLTLHASIAAECVAPADFTALRDAFEAAANAPRRPVDIETGQPVTFN